MAMDSGKKAMHTSSKTVVVSSEMARLTRVLIRGSYGALMKRFRANFAIARKVGHLAASVAVFGMFVSAVLLSNHLRQVRGASAPNHTVTQDDMEKWKTQ